MKINFLRENDSIECEEGLSLLEAARDNGICLCASACGMKKCGKCKVIITKGNDDELDSSEKLLLSKEEIQRGYRLACAMKVHCDIAVMTIGDNEFNCGFKKNSNNHGFNDNTNEYSSNNNNNSYNNNNTINENNKDCEDNNNDKDDKLHVAVLDVGTTTIEVYAFNDKLEQINKTSADNPLRLFGNDIISRIAYATTKDKLERMQGVLLDKCKEMIFSFKSVYGDEAFSFIVVTGNTAMLHIFTGNDVTPLGRFPFISNYSGGEIFTKLLGVKAIVPPFIKSHLGADALCCLIQALNEMKKNSDLPGTTMNEHKYLIMDIGTNSEMFLVADGRIWGCSTPAGPAFEESNITWGMKKGIGSVTKVEGDSFWLCTRGGMKKVNSSDKECADIKGMCASAVIDLLAELLEKKIVNGYGTMEDDYYLSVFNKSVCLSQKDIRNIQLAKAAIMTAVTTMLCEANVDKDEIDKVYLAGNFGNSIDVSNAIRIGLLPEIDVDKYVLMGNMAASGAAKLGSMYVDKGEEIFNYCEQLKNKVTHIELAENDFFKERYVEMMNFEEEWD